MQPDYSIQDWLLNGEGERAVQLIVQVDVSLERACGPNAGADYRLTPVEQARNDRGLAKLRSQIRMTPHDWEAAYAEGLAMSTEQAIEYAMQYVRDLPVSSCRPHNGLCYFGRAAPVLVPPVGATATSST